MSEVVVDSNILVKWFIPEDYHEEAKALLKDHLHGNVVVVVPWYALLEFANTLRKYVTKKIIGMNEVLAIYRLLIESAPHFIEEKEKLVSKALDYSVRRGTTVYDAYYIIIAQELNTVMYTADERLLRQLEGKEQLVRHIREYSIDRTD